MKPIKQTFERIDCSAAGLCLDRFGNPAIVAVGEGTLASVQTAVVSGTRSTWIGTVKRSSSPCGPWSDFATAETMTGTGLPGNPLDVADVEYLGIFNYTADSAIKVDITVRISAP